MIPRLTLRSVVAILLLSWLPAKSLDFWGGLHLDKSTPEDAIALFGKPEKEKRNQKLRTVIHEFEWLNKDDRYEKLEFKKIEGASKANFYFRSGVLKVMEIYLKKKGNPNTLESEYGAQFTRKTISSNNTLYYLIGISEPAFVVAQIDVLGLHRPHTLLEPTRAAQKDARQSRKSRSHAVDFRDNAEGFSQTPCSNGGGHVPGRRGRSGLFYLPVPR